MQDQCLQLLDLDEAWRAECEFYWAHLCDGCHGTWWNCMCEQAELMVW